MKAEQEQACEESGMFELRNTSSQNSNSFLEHFDRMNPWQRRRNFKPMKFQNSLVGTKAFIKDSLRQCARLVKAFGTKLYGCCKLSTVNAMLSVPESVSEHAH